MVLADILDNLISRNAVTSVKQIQDVYLRYAPESEMRNLLKTRDDEKMIELKGFLLKAIGESFTKENLAGQLKGLVAEILEEDTAMVYEIER